MNNTKQVDIRFKDDIQLKAFADACQLFIDQNGHFPTDQIIIHSVIDGTRWQQERDQVRAEYQMLIQRYEQVCKRNIDLEKKLKAANTSADRKRA